ncbi:MAG TPA: hypothetical protein VHK91_08210 [Flavisolibacter sp.]|nr:hypothetical protein [Flavisolibacter sp.]
MIATERQPELISYHPVLRFFAKIISVLFHPLFIPLYIGWFFIYIMRLFPERNEWDKTKLMISLFVNYTLLPLVSILLAKGLGFIQTIYLKTQKDRIIPYVVTGIFYFWVWYVFRNQHLPKEIVLFALATFLASSAGLLANSYLKVSMHAISVGVVITLFLLIGFSTYANFGLYISIALLVAGLVCTARLLTSDHNAAEVYIGLGIGILSQLIAYIFV